ncbi:MAG: hypothetical protein OXF05_04990, partial [Hyphomicrobiales bacterium]|nr:hypothetical protein [Hyphomicrobiales bacterium]
STLSEGDSSGNLTVSLSAEVSQDVVVTLTESGDGNNDLEFTPTSLTFAPGETSHNVTLTVNPASDDTLPEGDVEITYTLTGTLPDDVDFAADSHVVTFVDDDKTISFRDSSSSADEGTTGHPVVVVLNFDPPAGGLEVTATATGDHAGDVSIPSPVLNFTGTTLELPVLVNVLEDIVQEDAEIVQLELQESATPLPDGWTLLASGANDHDLTILPSDQTAMFAEAARTVNEGDGTISFLVTLSADAPSGGVPLEAAITSGNENGDVTFATQSFTIAEGASQHTLTVDVNDDGLVEPNETVTFTLSKDASETFPDAWGDLGTQTTFALTIRDNDRASVGFAAASSSLLEGDTTASLITVSLAGSVSQDVVVTLTESGDVNNDLAFSPASLTFAPGETDKQVTLTVNAANNDALPEGDVEITYTLAGSLPNGVAFGAKQHVVTLVDDDKTISFRDASSSATEGTTGHPVAVVLNFDPPSVGLDVTAVAKGDHKDDVSIPSPLINFTSTTRELPVLVNVLADGVQEGEEVVRLELEETVTPLPAGWTLIASGDNDHDLTILSSGQTAMFAEAGRTVNEGDGTISFRVTLSEDAPAGGVPLEVAITSGNENNDVTFATQNFTITGSNREHTLMVGINNDVLVEPSETVEFTLSEGADFPKSWGGLGTQTTFDLTITDDDSATVGFTTTTSTLKEGDTASATLTVHLTGSVSRNVVVTLRESGDGNDDLSVSPTTLTFAPGDTSEEVTLRVNPANDDAVPEADFNITYRLEGTLPQGVTFDPQEHVVTFVDDDKTIRFASSSSTAGEGTMGHPVGVVLNFDPPAGGLEVMAVAKDPHAGDVLIPSPVINFTDGARSFSVLVDVPADGVQEGTEIVRLELEETATPLPDGWTLFASNADDHDLTIPPSDQTAMFVEAGKTVNEDAGTVDFKVALSTAAPAGGVPLEVDITSGNDGDVTFTRERFRIEQGDREHMLTATVVDDSRVETAETIVFTLTKDATATFPDAWGDLGTPQTFELTILDNDEANIGFTSRKSVLLEGEDRKESLTVSLSGEVSQEVRVTLTESGDTKGDLTPSDSQGGEIDELVFKPGETSKDVFLKINSDDDIPEEDVRITYTLGGPLPDDISFSITDHVVLFADDDRTISFKTLASNVAEGFTGHPVGIVLNFDPPADGLEIMVSPRGAHSDEITIPDPVVSFASNTLEKDVLVNTIQDEVREGSQLVLLDLEENMSKRLPPGWSVTLEDSHDHDLTILASDQEAMFARSSLTVEEGAGTVEFKVRLTAGASAAHVSTETGDEVPAGVPLKVQVASGNDDGDITFTTQEFTIAEGAREHTLTVVIDDDSDVEQNETVVFELSKGANFPKDWGDLGTPASFRLTITDDDASIEFANARSSVPEDIGVTEIPLTLTGTPPVSGLPMRIEFEHLGSTTAEDYAFDTNPFIIRPAGPGEAYEIVVGIANDILAEADETLRMTLHTGEGFPSSWSGVSSQATHELTILASDHTAMFAETGRTVNEGQTSVSFEVELSAVAPTGGVPLAVSIVSGNGNNDVTSFSPESFVIAPGIDTQTISVVVADDAILEDTETIRFALAKDATETFPEKWGGLGTQTTFDLVITDNDASIAFVEEESEVAEDIGTANIPLALTRSPPTDGLEMEIVFQHVGSTTADDYTFSTNPFVILPADVTNAGTEWTYMLELPITDDPEVEGDEEMRLVLGTGGSFPPEWGGLGARATHKLTILSSDQTVQFAESGTTVDENVGDVTFDVVMTTGAPTDGLSLAVSSSDTGGVDVTFSPATFTISDGDDRMTITASVVDDVLPEGDETITFTLSKGAEFNDEWGDLGAQTTFDLTIRASDGTVAFANPTEQMVQEDAGAVMIPLDVTVAPPTDGLPMRVEIAGHGNNRHTATTDDYSFDPLAFTLMPAEDGEGYNLVFSIIDDDLPENEETFVFTLHTEEGFPTGWGGLGEKTTRYLTILPNDKTIGFVDTLPAELPEGTSDFPLEVVWNAPIENRYNISRNIRLGVEIQKAVGGGTDPNEPDVSLEFPPDTFNEFQDTSHESDYLNYTGSATRPTGSADPDRRIEMNVEDDKLLEEDEEIVVRLVPKQGRPLPDGWSIDPAEYRFTIPANDKFVGFTA